MAKEKIPLRNIQVTFQKSSLLTKVIVICTIVLASASLIAMRISQTLIQEETAELEKEAASLIVENQALAEKTADVDSVQGVQQIAQEELDMVYPDTEFFVSANDSLEETE